MPWLHPWAALSFPRHWCRALVCPGPRDRNGLIRSMETSWVCLSWSQCIRTTHSVHLNLLKGASTPGAAGRQEDVWVLEDPGDLQTIHPLGSFVEQAGIWKKTQDAWPGPALTYLKPLCTENPESHTRGCHSSHGKPSRQCVSASGSKP